jgi:hypothetical protein
LADFGSTAIPAECPSVGSSADLRDYAVVCLAEARLTCLKQALAQRMRVADRRDFMGRCLGP